MQIGKAKHLVKKHAITREKECWCTPVCPLLLRILGIVYEALIWSNLVYTASGTMLFAFRIVTFAMAQQLSSIIIFGHFLIIFSKFIRLH